MTLHLSSAGNLPFSAESCTHTHTHTHAAHTHTHAAHTHTHTHTHANTHKRLQSWNQFSNPLLVGMRFPISLQSPCLLLSLRVLLQVWCSETILKRFPWMFSWGRRLPDTCQMRVYTSRCHCGSEGGRRSRVEAAAARVGFSQYLLSEILEPVFSHTLTPLDYPHICN